MAGPELVAAVVVCEGEEAALDLLCDRLVSGRFDPLPARTAEEALRLCRHQRPDLLVVDLELPDGEGPKLLRRIREAPWRQTKIDRYLPVLALRARESDPWACTDPDLAADDYLEKPFAYEDLRSRIETILRRRHSRHDEAVRVGELTGSGPSQGHRRRPRGPALPERVHPAPRPRLRPDQGLREAGTPQGCLGPARSGREDPDPRQPREPSARQARPRAPSLRRQLLGDRLQAPRLRSACPLCEVEQGLDVLGDSLAQRATALAEVRAAIKEQKEKLGNRITEIQAVQNALEAVLEVPPKDGWPRQEELRSVVEDLSVKSAALRAASDQLESVPSTELSIDLQAEMVDLREAADQAQASPQAAALHKLAELSGQLRRVGEKSAAVVVARRREATIKAFLDIADSEIKAAIEAALDDLAELVDRYFGTLTNDPSTPISSSPTRPNAAVRWSSRLSSTAASRSARRSGS